MHWLLKSALFAAGAIVVPLLATLAFGRLVPTNVGSALVLAAPLAGWLLMLLLAMRGRPIREHLLGTLAYWAVYFCGCWGVMWIASVAGGH